ncbi:MAG TPA: ATP-binding protein [Terracidiphilus sp.]|nr:ATP-binding protein [Terracidiphilus sp.]
MRGLFLKIFIIFWIAQSLIFVISTALIVRRHFEGPQATFDLLNSTMEADARGTVRAYETGGCDALKAFGAGISQAVALEDAGGKMVCTVSGFEGIENAAPAPATGRQSGIDVGTRYVWRLPVTSASGARYTFLLSRPRVAREPINWYRDLLRFSFPQLPVAIAVGGLMTFVLVLLFTRPLARLRKAAGELATGKLTARVAWPAARSQFFGRDEIQALMHDFNHMAERLESLVDAQKLLLRDVSHELRSPLARLSVALELARDDADSPMTTHLDRIERETVRLNLLIGQLLTLSSMEALERIENFEPVSLNGLIERLIPDAEYEAKQRACSVVFHDRAKCTILGNEELLYRAVENVVRNAIRYAESGTEVEIELAANGVNGERRATIVVNDRGPGIPEDQLNAIFRPFYRVDTARSPDTGGFGVGLAIAERAVRLHKGELSAANREGGGAMIRMSFPALEATDEAARAGNAKHAKVG